MFGNKQKCMKICFFYNEKREKYIEEGKTKLFAR